MIGSSGPRQKEASMAIQFDDLGMPRVPALRTVGITAAIIVAVFVLGALAFNLFQQRIWGAEADVLLSPGGDMSDAAVERAFATQQLILRSPTVLQPVANAAKIPIKDLDESLSIAMVNRSNVLRLTVANPDRATAVNLAQMITDQYRRGFTSGGPQLGQGQLQATVLTRAHPLERPLEPQPLRALAAGAIAGLLIAAAAVAVMLWPRFATDRFSWE
jgi:uncharacterized protein involved in exopolysaccharide biosynthesis